MAGKKELGIVVYGATGYTGKLVAEYMHRQYGVNGEVSWAIAGALVRPLSNVSTPVIRCLIAARFSKLLPGSIVIFYWHRNVDFKGITGLHFYPLFNLLTSLMPGNQCVTSRWNVFDKVLAIGAGNGKVWIVQDHYDGAHVGMQMTKDRDYPCLVECN